jgi:hypothetical protein
LSSSSSSSSSLSLTSSSSSTLTTPRLVALPVPQYLPLTGHPGRCMEPRVDSGGPVFIL